jgi:hypothetical protein
MRGRAGAGQLAYDPLELGIPDRRAPSRAVGAPGRLKEPCRAVGQFQQHPPLDFPAQDLGLRRVEEPAPRAIVVQNLMSPHGCSLATIMYQWVNPDEDHRRHPIPAPSARFRAATG